MKALDDAVTGNHAISIRPPSGFMCAGVCALV
jgi:hypothetical protein